MASVVRAQYRVWLEVDHPGGTTKYDCSSVSINFGLNKVPSASATLAIGRNALTGKQAPIHDHANDFTSVRVARIWLDAQGSSNPVKAEQWTAAGPQIIFDGYIAGIGYRRTYNTTLPVVMLVHWLSDLNFSSILSESSHPANPARFRWHPSSPGSIDAEPEGLDEFLSTRVSRDLILPDNFMGTTGDLWGKCLHKIFADLADKDILWRFNEDACVATSDTNENSKKALARIETSKGVEKIGPDSHTGASSPYHVPLRMNTGPIEGLVADAIYEHLRRTTLDSYFNSTFWDKVVGELAPAYYFSVVPRIKTAMIVPYVPGLRDVFQKIIDFRDVTDWSSSASSVRPLRAVGIMPSNMKSFAGEGMTVPVNVLGGCFTPKDEKDRPGMIIYRTPPQWLDDVPLHAHNPIPDPNNQPSSTTPTAPKPRGEEPTSPGEAMNEMKNYYDRVAHYMFAQEMLRGRYAVLQGKLRFDIAPGTTVLIKNSPPKFLEKDQLSVNLIASVSRVGIVIDAESSSAATSFQIDYIRTEAENASDATSVAGHPLYEESFKGAPLLHEYLFSET